ncbi:MAG: archease [Thermoanaerobaculia bacterium]
MGYRRLEHTADTGLELWAESLSALFNQAVRGFTDTVTELGSVEAREVFELSCTAAGRERLLVACLEELVYEFEVRGRVFCRADSRIAGDDAGWSLEATVHGERFDADRHHLKVPIKGVTYHRLALFEDIAGWRGRVVFDI